MKFLSHFPRRGTPRSPRPSASFRPRLEPLEERCLLDASPIAQLGTDMGKEMFNLTRAAVDAAVFADEVAIVSGGATPEGIATLAALAPAMKYPAMVADVTGLYKDFQEGNVAGMAADLAGLTRDTALGLAADLVAIQQGSMAILKDLPAAYGEIEANALGFLTPNPQPAPPNPQPAPTPPPSQNGPAAAIAGTYSGNLVPSNANDAPGSTARAIQLTINPDGSGSLSVAPFEDQQQISTNFAAAITQNSDGTITLGATPGNFEIDLIGARVVNGNQLATNANGSFTLTDVATGNAVQFNGNTFLLTKQ